MLWPCCMTPLRTPHYSLRADHYTGITDTWKEGEIYCSEVTGKLVVYLLGVDPQLVHTLPMNSPQQIQGEHACLCCNSTHLSPASHDDGITWLALPSGFMPHMMLTPTCTHPPHPTDCCLLCYAFTDACAATKLCRCSPESSSHACGCTSLPGLQPVSHQGCPSHCTTNPRR